MKKLGLYFKYLTLGIGYCVSLSLLIGAGVLAGDADFIPCAACLVILWATMEITLSLKHSLEEEHKDDAI